MPLNKNKIDVSQVFLTYMALVGNADKTALALELEVADVIKLAEDEGWNAKVRSITLLSKGGTPGDYERATNRALNYVQAHRMRCVMEEIVGRVVQRMKDNDDSDYIEVTVNGARVHVKVCAKFFSDMAAAIEKMQAMTYMALGDSATDRKQSDTDQPGGKSVDVHMAVINALNGAMVGKPSPMEALKLVQDSIAPANP